MRYNDIYRLHKKAAPWYDPFNLFTEEDALQKLQKQYQQLFSQYSRLNPNSPEADALYKQLRENMIATQNEKARRDIISSRQQEAWGDPLYTKPRSWLQKFSDNVKGIFDPDIQGNINKLRDAEERRMRTSPSVNTQVTQQDLDDYFKAQQIVLRGPAAPSTAPIARPTAAPIAPNSESLMDQGAADLSEQIFGSTLSPSVSRATTTPTPVKTPIKQNPVRTVPKSLKSVSNTGAVKPINQKQRQALLTQRSNTLSKQINKGTIDAVSKQKGLPPKKRYLKSKAVGKARTGARKNIVKIRLPDGSSAWVDQKTAQRMIDSGKYSYYK